MSEKLPVISGSRLIKVLQQFGYEIVRQKGSHVRMVKNAPSGKHKITIPNHNPMAKGTLSDILTKVATWCQTPKDELINKIKKK